MIVEDLAIAGVKLIKPRIHRDVRGFFCETYNARTYADAGITAAFVQDNHSFSIARGTIRGLHFQAPPHAQGKLVRVTSGSVFDVAVDIRHGSPSFGHFVSAVLSSENGHQLWVPPGFAHGFCTLEPDTEFLYKVTGYYAPQCDFGLAWDDPELAIDWPVEASQAVLSDKDRRHPRLRDLPHYFAFAAEPSG